MEDFKIETRCVPSLTQEKVYVIEMHLNGKSCNSAIHEEMLKSKELTLDALKAAFSSLVEKCFL